MRQAIAVVLAILLIAPPLTARNNSDWNNVRKLKHGTKILVSLWNGDQLDGRVESVSDTGLSIGSPEGTRANAQWSQAVERGTVRRIVRLRGGHGDLPDPGKVMLIGAAIGGAAGAIGGGIKDVNHGNQLNSLTYGFGGAVFGFLGAVVVLTGIATVALVRGPRRTEVVYENVAARPAGQARPSPQPN
jgi:hypothetical protein